MAIYLADTTVQGERGEFTAGPFETTQDAALSGKAGYLFQVTGAEKPVLLPVYLREKMIKQVEVEAAGNLLAPSSE